MNLRIALVTVTMMALTVVAHVLLDGIVSLVAFVGIIAAWLVVIRLLGWRFANRNAKPS